VIAFTDKSGAPTGAEALTSEYATIESLARTIMNDAGQTVATRQYFDLGGLTYSTALALGTEGVNYLETDYVYDPLGRTAAVTDPAGTITHVFYLRMCQLGGGDFLDFVGGFFKRGIGWSSFSQMSMAA